MEEEVDKDIFETWLKINNIKAVMYDMLGTSEPQLCAEKVALMMAASGGRGMYLDTSPHTVAKTMALGIPSMLVCQPYVVRPEWSSSKTMKGWNMLVEEIDKQAIARSERNWGELD